MSRFARLAAPFAALLLTVVATRSADAADQKAALDKIKAKNQAAQSAFGASDFEEMKSQLMDAVAVGNESGLAKAKIMAQTYVLLGVLQVDGFKDTEAGIRFFVKALDINPAVQIPSNMATKAVKAAFKRAEDEDPGEAGGAEAEAPKSSKGSGSGKESTKAPKQDRDEQAEQERAERQVAAALASAADKKRADQESAAERRRADAEAKRQAEAERKERDKLTEELAAAKVGESTQQAERDRLLKEKQDKDRQLGDTKGRLQQLEKAKADADRQLAATQGQLQQLQKVKADQDKQLADAKGQLQQLQKAKADEDKQLAATQLSEKNERAAKEKAQGERLERDKQLADAKGQLQQLQKAKADEDKQLAATQLSEKNERAAKEKVQGTLQEIASREKERRGREEKEKVDREKLEEGPDLPGHISEPITCTVPDEVEAGADLFVHCLPQPGVGAKVVALYYRPAGSVLYNAAIMERSKKGWYTAMIPGSKINGRLLHYYVEARDAHQGVAAANGKANSPNIATVRSGAAPRRAKSH